MPPQQILRKPEPLAARRSNTPEIAAPGLPPIADTERKSATVMFVDIQGSMALSRGLELETWWLLIDELFRSMCRSVDASGGWVGSFTGDGIKGVFEAPHGTPDHARRACAAALRLRDAVRVRARELFRQSRTTLAVRIGLHSGEIMTGSIGDRHNRYYTAGGFVVALAKRIEALAPPDQIYLTASTARLVEEAFRLRDCGAFDVKGAELPINVFELVEADARARS
jgi:class 3 adenylate cyclase